jgi:hypothetical protein
MENENEPYIFYQGGITYILSSSIDSDKIKLLCQVIYLENKTNYLGIFSFSDMKKLNPCFNKCLNIANVRELIRNCIKQNTILVKDYKSYIDLVIFIFDESENICFSFNKINNNNYILKNDINNNNNFDKINQKNRRYYITLNLPLIKTNYYATNIPPIKNSNYESKYDDLNSSQNININNQFNKVYNNKSPLIKEINTSNNKQQKEKSINDKLGDLSYLYGLEKEYEKVELEIVDLEKNYNLVNSQIKNYMKNNNLQKGQNQNNEEWKVINQKLLKENQELKNQLNSLNNLAIEIYNSNIYAKGEIFKNYEELEFICRRIGHNYNRISLKSNSRY